MSTPKPDSLPDVIRDQIEVESGGCWIWTGRINGRGYGALGDGRVVHRVARELLVGPIPQGLVLDHDCHNRDVSCPGGPCRHRRCCNPDHVIPRSFADNVRLGRAPAATRARHAAIKDCPHGHPYDEANTGRRIRAAGGRRCRACAVRQTREWNRRVDSGDAPVSREKLRGVANGRAVLSESDVRAIRSQRDLGPRELARRYSVDPKTVRSILSGRAWRHLLGSVS